MTKVKKIRDNKKLNVYFFSLIEYLLYFTHIIKDLIYFVDYIFILIDNQYILPNENKNQLFSIFILFPFS